MCTDTTESESGEAEGQNALYLAGADSSFLIRPHKNTHAMEISGPHTFTHKERLRQAFKTGSSQRPSFLCSRTHGA